MIRGYPERSTVVGGDDLVLRVSTGAPEFRVDLYRFGRAVAPVAPLFSSEWLPGRARPDHLPHEDWGREGEGLAGEALPAWPSYRLTIRRQWPPGVYVADLVEGDGRGRELAGGRPPTTDGRHAKALFVVRGSSPTPRCPILYKLPLFTYHAYNCVSDRGWCLYSIPEAGKLPRSVPPSVSLRRPGGGTGGIPWDIGNFDPFDPTPRQTFVHWDGPFVRWLEENGYEVDYCTDLDLHRAGPDLLAGRRLLVSAGHDEYWTDAMRDRVEAFVHAGGNLAFFGGNTCWWRVTFDDDDCTFRRVGEWWDPNGPGRPENSLTGLSFRHGGERDRDEHPTPVGYQVQHADHWVYDGTGLGDGDRFGDGRDEYLVGYECDGAHFDRAAFAAGRPATASGDDGTPPGFVILGVGDTVPSGWGNGNRAATMGVFTAGGTVFNAATTDWARLLGAGHPAVGRITRNVLDRLG
jgi:hypothetical protein